MADDTAVQPKKSGLMKRAGVVIAGLFVGSVAAAGVQYSVGATVPAALAKERADRPQAMEYVDLGKVTVPVVDSDGDLVRYVTINASLEVPKGAGDATKSKLPVVLHEINMATWKSALSSGPDGELVDTNAVERIFESAAKQVYGKDVPVNRVLLTSTVPA